MLEQENVSCGIRSVLKKQQEEIINRKRYGLFALWFFMVEWNFFFFLLGM